MTHILGSDRSQLLLLPEAIDDYVTVDNPVRFIDAFVEGLDLKAAGFARVEAKATGRPGYAPGDLLKLYIYGYLNRVRSSRRLEAECHRNIEVIWLLGGLKPDFKTIADFRSVNRTAFKKVFREFVILCRRLDLFGRELLAVDGTRIKAVNNKDRNFTTGSLQKFIAAVDKKLEDYLNRLDAGDTQEHAASGSRVKNLAEKIAALKTKRGEYAAHLSRLEKNGESQISLTDPDSRAMAGYTKVGVGYNAQIAVDAKHKMIVEQAVSNDVLDMACCNRPPSLRARFWASRRSMWWPTRVILGPRTARPASKQGSRPMCQSHNVDPQWQAVSSAKMSFAMTLRKTSIFVLAGMNSNQSGRAGCAI
jgi:transposase